MWLSSLKGWWRCLLRAAARAKSDHPGRDRTIVRIDGICHSGDRGLWGDVRVVRCRGRLDAATGEGGHVIADPITVRGSGGACPSPADALPGRRASPRDRPVLVDWFLRLGGPRRIRRRERNPARWAAAGSQAPTAVAHGDPAEAGRSGAGSISRTRGPDAGCWTPTLRGRLSVPQLVDTVG